MGWQAGLGARGSHPLRTPHSSALSVPLRKGEGGSAVSESGVCGFLLTASANCPLSPSGVITATGWYCRLFSSQGTEGNTLASYARELCWRAAVGWGPQGH